MEKDPVIVVGGSAGSLDVILKIMSGLNENFKPPLIVVLHRGHTEQSLLPDLLSTKTRRTVKEIEDKEEIKPGLVYVAPGDYHLLFESNGTCALDASEKVNYSRPSIDVAFESAAEAFGTRTIGILLSGANNDGTVGLQAIKKAGGTVLIQDPKSAQVPFMVQNALSKMKSERVYNVEQIITFLNAYFK